MICITSFKSSFLYIIGIISALLINTPLRYYNCFIKVSNLHDLIEQEGQAFLKYEFPFADNKLICKNV